MDNEFHKSVFYRAFMTAVFVGIVATIVALFYDMIFVSVFDFPLSSIINVSSLIFGVNIIFLIVGAIFYLFVSSFKKGHRFYILFFVLVTAFLAWRSEHVIRSADIIINHKFQGLLTGMVLILGAMAAFLIPFLYHSKKFDDNVL
jgi:hypothetical protein